MMEGRVGMERRTSLVVNFVIRVIVGCTMIFFANEWLDMQGYAAHVGFNLITLLTSGTLGIPGVALLYGITFYKIL